MANALLRRPTHLGLFVIALAWFVLAPGLASAQSGLDHSIEDIKSDLALADCKGSNSSVGCDFAHTAVLFLHQGAVSRGIETAEMHVLVAAKPRPDPKEESANRSAAIRLVRYFLPEWEDGPAWLAYSLDEAARVRGKQLIQLGWGPMWAKFGWKFNDRVTVLVVRQDFADVDGSYAAVVITRKKSLDEWLDPIDY